MMPLSALYNSFAQHKESQWIMKPGNARILFTFLKEYPIKSVLDLGTGIGLSAAVCALVLSEKGKDFHIDTVEQNEKCFKLAQELIPVELKEKISFHLSPPVVWSTPEIPYQFFMNFKELPEVQPDLIITDGPGEYLDENGHHIYLPNGDVMKLHMEDKIKKGTFLFFDGRIKTIQAVERYFSDNFYTLEAASNKCNILERKDNPVKFFDERKDYFEKLGYFLS